LDLEPGGPRLAKVGKLFAIRQVVAEIADHWPSEPTKRGSTYASLIGTGRLRMMSVADSVRDLRPILFAERMVM